LLHGIVAGTGPDSVKAVHTLLDRVDDFERAGTDPEAMRHLAVCSAWQERRTQSRLSWRPAFERSQLG
jgi:hypothetical protein